MIYVNTIQYTDAKQMIAAAHNLRKSIMSARPKPQVMEIPTIIAKAYIKDDYGHLLDQNSHVVEYRFHLQFKDYLTRTSDPEIAYIKRMSTKIRVQDIIRETCLYFDISMIDLLSVRRTRSIVKKRQMAMYLAKKLTMRSLPEIGRRFGDRDHTTVHHAIKQIEALILVNKEISKAVADITARLKAMAQ